MAGLFQSGTFTLHSGSQSAWKIDCDSLTNDDLETLAQMAAEILPAFGEVIGVPEGGLRFAEALRRYSRLGPTLIADDVLTTGGSMERFHMVGTDLGVVIFARGKCPDWVTPLFQIPIK